MLVEFGRFGSALLDDLEGWFGLVGKLVSKLVRWLSLVGW